MDPFGSKGNTKGNNLDTQAASIEFSEYVNNNGVIVY